MKLSTTVLQTILERRSNKGFDPEKTIDQDSIERIIQATHAAPSSFNEQPWRVIINNKHKNFEMWHKVFSSLVLKNQTWAENAPILITVCCTPNFSIDNNKNHHAEHDTGMATMALCLQAHAEGLASHIMGGFEILKIKAALNIPKEIKVTSIIAIGHGKPFTQPESPEYIPPQLNRKDINFCFFHDQWPTLTK